MIRLEKDGIQMGVCDKTQACPFLRNGWTEVHSGEKAAPIKEPEQVEEAPVAEHPSVDAPVANAEEEKPKRGRKPANKAE